jgi:NAD-dependent dihydropyrimidine dehydrogenase PreA subunit
MIDAGADLILTTVEMSVDPDDVTREGIRKAGGNAECVEACPSDEYEIQNSKAVPTGIDGCIECCACVESCPENAIDHSACE